MLLFFHRLQETDYRDWMLLICVHVYFILNKILLCLQIMMNIRLQIFNIILVNDASFAIM